MGQEYGEGVGAALSGQYLMFSCFDNGFVYVYSAYKFGVGQPPVETIGSFTQPQGVVVGP